jgi:hypothetical protein
VKGQPAVYLGGPGVWHPTPNADWIATAHVATPGLQLVTLPTAQHLAWTRDYCLNVLSGARNA